MVKPDLNIKLGSSNNTLPIPQPPPTRAVAEKPAAVEERTLKPPGLSRFVRTSNSKELTQQTKKINDNIFDENDESHLTDAEICQQLLVGGFVQSFVDLFNHNSSSPSTNRDLLFMRDNLIAAELARRRGNTNSVYVAYTTMADYFVQKSDWKTCIYFHEKCLEVAKLTTDSRAEMAALHALGSICQSMGDFETALKFHERHQERSIGYDVLEETKKANVELFKVYSVLAEKLEIAGNHTDALECFMKCLEAAKKCWNRAAEGEANGKIGSLLLLQGRPEESIPYFKEYAEISTELGFSDSRCRACSGLALAYDSLGKAEKALTELKMVQVISEKAGDVRLQAQSSRALGTLQSKLGNLAAAVEAFQLHFSLVKQILSTKSPSSVTAGTGAAASTAADTVTGGHSDTDSVMADDTAITTKDFDLARAYVGISMGNLNMGRYLITIEKGDDIHLLRLLNWKLDRLKLNMDHGDAAMASSTKVPDDAADGEGEGDGSDGDDDDNDEK